MYQVGRGCRHETVVHYWLDHPKYGNKVLHVESRKVEVQCDKSCGQRG